MAIHNLLELWKLTDKVQTLSFDICQHWALQWSVRSAGRQDRSKAPVVGLPSPCDDFSQSIHFVLGPSNSPHIPIFQTYKAAWESVMQDWISYPALSPIMKQHSVFSRSLLKESQIQGSEMTTKNSLSWKWLSWKLTFNNSLESPGPIHHASWMPSYCMPSKSTFFVINVVYSN